MAAKLTRLTHKIAIQLRLVAESCTIRSFRFRRFSVHFIKHSSCQKIFQTKVIDLN
jgi:hypothetical protein